MTATKKKSTGYDLKARLREDSEFGTAAARRLRDAGEFPAILYGHGGETIHMAVNSGDMESAIRNHERIFTLTLTNGSGKGKTDQAMLKDVQYDTLTDAILHADFIRIAMDEKLEFGVEVVAIGAPPAGVLEQVRKEVAVECLATEVPDTIEMTVFDLEVGDYIRVEDLPNIDGVEYLEEPEAVVFHVASAEAVEEDVEIEEEILEPEVIGREVDEDEEFEEGEEPQAEVEE